MVPVMVVETRMKGATCTVIGELPSTTSLTVDCRAQSTVASDFGINGFAPLVGGYSGQQKSISNTQTGYDHYDALPKYGDQSVPSVTSVASPYGGLTVATNGPYADRFNDAEPAKWRRLATAYLLAADFNTKTEVQLVMALVVGWARTRNR
jgi:hypothetical protein